MKALIKLKLKSRAICPYLHADAEWEWEGDDHQEPGADGEQPAAAAHAIGRVIRWNKHTNT